MTHSFHTRRSSDLDVTRMKGRDLQRVRAKFGMLFQSGALFDLLPVWRNVTFALRQGHVSQSSEMRRIALENLKMVGLGADVLNQIGRAHVCTPVTNAHLVCRLLLEKKKNNSIVQHKNTQQ